MGKTRQDMAALLAAWRDSLPAKVRRTCECGWERPLIVALLPDGEPVPPVFYACPRCGAIHEGVEVAPPRGLTTGGKA